jgi:hypothetical protein
MIRSVCSMNDRTSLPPLGPDRHVVQPAGSADSGQETSPLRRVEFWLAGALLAFSVFPGFGSSLWLDETFTWWIVRDGLADAWSRAMWWSNTPPLYYCVVWLLAKTFGLGTAVLRVPSIVFSLGTAVALYRLARRWMDVEGATLGVLVFFCLPAVQFTVIDARPYALGLLLLVLAWLSMMRWLESGGSKEGLAFILCAAGVVWTHYTIAIGLLPLLWYWRRLGWRRAAVAVAAVAGLVIPLVAQVVGWTATRGEHMWSSPPGAVKTVYTLIPVSAFAVLILGAMMTVFNSKPRTQDFKPYAAKQSLVPLVLLAFMPPALFFLLSRAGIVHLFEPRYLLCKEVGLALLAAWALRGLTDSKLRRATAIAAVILIVPWSLMNTTRHGDQDWRESSEWVKEELRIHPETRLVLVSGFMETFQAGHLDDPRYQEVLIAPQLVYPVPAEPILLPLWPTQEAKERLEKLVAPAAQRAGRIVVVSLSDWPPYKPLFEQCLRRTGLRLTEKRLFGEVMGHVFER